MVIVGGVISHLVAWGAYIYRHSAQDAISVKVLNTFTRKVTMVGVDDLWQAGQEVVMDDELMKMPVHEWDDDGITDADLLSADPDVLCGFRLPLRPEVYKYHVPSITCVPPAIRKILRRSPETREAFDYIEDACLFKSWPSYLEKDFFSSDLTYKRRFEMAKFFWFNGVSLYTVLKWYQGIGAFDSPKELRRTEFISVWTTIEKCRELTPAKLYNWKTYSVMERKRVRMHHTPYEREYIPM